MHTIAIAIASFLVAVKVHNCKMLQYTLRRPAGFVYRALNATCEEHVCEVRTVEMEGRAVMQLVEALRCKQAALCSWGQLSL